MLTNPLTKEVKKKWKQTTLIASRLTETVQMRKQAGSGRHVTNKFSYINSFCYQPERFSS